MTGAEIRSSFLDFFRQRGHEVVRSSSLVPDKDPTLLFTNAGMVQFKNVFLGNEKRANPRAVDSQKCLRLSGKHNDLEEVGRDTYHHTFFEMLGNWSFGDYYKKEAIAWAWELLTKEWQLPKDRLYATVFTTDDEAERRWRNETDIGHARILRFGEKDNFWEMGETGPCGPCSEVHIDRGAGTCDRQHVPGHTCAVNAGCARYIELWNLVFIQYNRVPGGALEDLRATHVDTGAGLERLAAVLQGVQSNYDTDLLRNLIRFTEEHARRRYGQNVDDDLAFRVIADHSRALTFMIADGVVPGNEGRGYVLRRILRRAARHARQLGFTEPYLWHVTKAVAETMGDAYPEIIERHSYIEEVIRNEEERFAETLDKGLALLDQERRTLRQRSANELPGEVAFRLYDTFGFPLDMTEDILREDGMTVDTAGFERSMDEQRRRAREARKATDVGVTHGTFVTRFVGDRVDDVESEVLAVYRDGEEHSEVREGDEVQVVTAETPFYGESGGQVGDRGQIESVDGALIEVTDTQKPRSDVTIHIGTVRRGALQRGQRVHLRIDRAWREAARLNHSATHILHAVLRERLGTHVRQAGSLVAPDRLRFDFTHPTAIDEHTLTAIEEETNAHIRDNADVVTSEMGYDDAIKQGALAFFGDKYGDRVRVVKMGDFSVELCGGTHVRRTGDIGVFKLRGEAGVAAGVRRVEAMTGAGALQSIREREITLRQLGELVKGNETEVAEKVERLLTQQRELERQLQQLRSQLAGSQSADLLDQAFTTSRGFRVVTAEVVGAEQKPLLEMADALRDRMGSGVVILASGVDNRVNLLAAVTKDLAGQYNAGKIIGQLAPIVGGRGGGRPELAQAGGKDPSKIADALKAARELFEKGVTTALQAAPTTPLELHFTDDRLIHALFGNNDEHLKAIERSLGVRIGTEGHSLLISGDDVERELAGRVLTQLYSLIENGYPVYTSDVDYAIRILSRDRNANLREIFLDTIYISSHKRVISPKSVAQKAYIEAVRNYDIVFGIGPAGTGKTYLAMAMAVAELMKNNFARMILTRPAVEAGEKLGFLPGDLAEKVNPYLRPLYDALHDMVDFDRAQKMLERGVIEVAPLAFMRGRTLNDSFVILDEAQNTTGEQMKMFLTRLGYGSKAVITGDVTQIDLPAGRSSGLKEAQLILAGIDGIRFCTFTERDVVRHRLVQDIISAYDRFEGRRDAAAPPPGRGQA